MTLEATGERLLAPHYLSDPADRLIYAMHLATYRFALPHCRARRVLDYGCGSGWGAQLVATVAADVVAVDASVDAIAHAGEHYPHPHLHYRAIEADAALPFAAGGFDTVLSFQVIEHVADEDRYLGEIRRVLKPGGVALFATPDRDTRLLPLQRPWNRWHLREYHAAQLHSRLARHFDTVVMLAMSGPRELIDVELRRCRRLRWATLPVTLPILPDRLRVAALNGLHALRRPRRPDADDGAEARIDAIASRIRIAPGLAPSLNLVAVARS